MHNYFEYPFEMGLLARYNRYMQHHYRDKGGVDYLKDRYR